LGFRAPRRQLDRLAFPAVKRGAGRSGSLAVIGTVGGRVRTAGNIIWLALGYFMASLRNYRTIWVPCVATSHFALKTSGRAILFEIKRDADRLLIAPCLEFVERAPERAVRQDRLEERRSTR